MTSRVAVILVVLAAVACGRAQSRRKSKFNWVTSTIRSAKRF